MLLNLLLSPKPKSIIIMTDLLVGPVDVQEQWSSWKEKFSKSYESDEEEQKRFGIFENNLNSIVEHNERYQAGEETYTKALNQFADLASDDIKRHLVMRRPLKQ